MNYQEAVDFINDVPRFTTKNKPENTIELIERLGRPDRKMKLIHVAGTNGKGSVCAFLASTLQHAGYRVGLFTSPHLVTINERFQINQIPVSDETFLQAFLKVKRVIEEMTADGFCHPTYFEILFAVCMVIFGDAGLDYAVLETGLGGRLDATNVIEHPQAVVLTSISLDHMEYLGNTVEQIAWEKAGIIKEGVPVIYDGRNPSIEAVIRREAARKHARPIPYKESFSKICGRGEKTIDFSVQSGYYEGTVITVPYVADYQVVNSSLALLALEVLDPEHRIPQEETVAAGIAETRWQGRMETVLPGVIVDGAHNEAGIEEFIKTVKQIHQTKRVTLLFSAVVEKEYDQMIRTICEETALDEVIVTQIAGSRIVPASQLAGLFREYTDAPVTAVEDIGDAFALARERKGDGVLFCAGSLYLVGEIKARLRRKTDD